MKFLGSIWVSLGLGLTAVAVAEKDESIPEQTWYVDTIPWQEDAPDGSRYALLSGRRDLAKEPFSYAFAIPAGLWDPPHFHSQDVFVFVAKGTLYLGYGERHDSNLLEAYPSGSMLIVPGGKVHFDGSHEDTVIFGVATGEWSTTYLESSAGASAGTPE